jgi:hypothetical protein
MSMPYFLKYTRRMGMFVFDPLKPLQFIVCQYIER